MRCPYAVGPSRRTPVGDHERVQDGEPPPDKPQPTRSVTIFVVAFLVIDVVGTVISWNSGHRGNVEMFVLMGLASSRRPVVDSPLADVTDPLTDGSNTPSNGAGATPG